MQPNVAGWLMTEKLDGMRGYWDGRQLWTRRGNPIYTPRWFTAGLPKDATLDGELWLRRNSFEATMRITRRHEPLGGWSEDDDWKKITYRIFDSPSAPQGLGVEGRLDWVSPKIKDCAYAKIMKMRRINNNEVSSACLCQGQVSHAKPEPSSRAEASAQIKTPTLTLKSLLVMIPNTNRRICFRR